MAGDTPSPARSLLRQLASVPVRTRTPLPPRQGFWYWVRAALAFRPIADPVPEPPPPPVTAAPADTGAEKEAHTSARPGGDPGDHAGAETGTRAVEAPAESAHGEGPGRVLPQLGTELTACARRMLDGPAAERLRFRQETDALSRELVTMRDYALARVENVHGALGTFDPWTAFDRVGDVAGDLARDLARVRSGALARELAHLLADGDGDGVPGHARTDNLAALLENALSTFPDALSRAVANDNTAEVAPATRRIRSLGEAFDGVLADLTRTLRERMGRGTAPGAAGFTADLTLVRALTGVCAFAVVGALARDLVGSGSREEITGFCDLLPGAVRRLQGAAKDFRGADLRTASLEEADLSWLRWHEHTTRWPEDWTERIRRMSVEQPEGSGEYVVLPVLDGSPAELPVGV